MKERGILFTPENHRAIIIGRKTATRRVINPQPQPPGTLTSGDGNWRVLRKNGMTEVFDWTRCPYGKVGDELYVKEGVIIHASIPQLVGYCLDGCKVTEYWEKHLKAMFMPKWAARTWLEITEFRVERVQDISEEDAKAEGVEQRSRTTWRNYFEDCYLSSAQQSYSSLWQAINGKNKPGGDWDAWEANPFCWVLTFKLVGR